MAHDTHAAELDILVYWFHSVNLKWDYYATGPPMSAVMVTYMSELAAWWIVRTFYPLNPIRYSNYIFFNLVAVVAATLVRRRLLPGSAVPRHRS